MKGWNRQRRGKIRVRHSDMGNGAALSWGAVVSSWLDIAWLSRLFAVRLITIGLRKRHLLYFLQSRAPNQAFDQKKEPVALFATA